MDGWNLREQTRLCMSEVSQNDEESVGSGSFHSYPQTPCCETVALSAMPQHRKDAIIKPIDIFTLRRENVTLVGVSALS